MEKDNYWLLISSGNGPEECAFAVGRIMNEVVKDAGAHSVEIKILQKEQSAIKDNYKSVLLGIEGKDAALFCRSWQGTVKCIFTSPYRKLHKRKNWYIGISCLIPPAFEEFDTGDILITAVKASGPGGQNVNKTNTAVRITHRQTGLVACASEERSQLLNKQLALAKLKLLLDERNRSKLRTAEEEQWRSHQQLERGNEEKIYKGINFERVL